MGLYPAAGTHDYLDLPEWLRHRNRSVIQSLPYSVYVFTGTMIWAIFMDAVNAPLQRTSAARQMLAKINFPREALIVSGIYQTLFNGAIKIVLLLSALMLFGIYPGWTLILFPIGILSLILAGTALGLLLTPIGVLYTDIGKSMPLLMQFLMYLTPVVFPMPNSGWAAIVFKLNPVTPLILTTRDWLTGFSSQLFRLFLYCQCVCFRALTCGLDDLSDRHADFNRTDERIKVMLESLVKVENVSKKFCRDLKRSLWYGMKDLGSELLG